MQEFFFSKPSDFTQIPWVRDFLTRNALSAFTKSECLCLFNGAVLFEFEWKIVSLSLTVVFFKSQKRALIPDLSVLFKTKTKAHPQDLFMSFLCCLEGIILRTSNPEQTLSFLPTPLPMTGYEVEKWQGIFYRNNFENMFEQSEQEELLVLN